MSIPAQIGPYEILDRLGQGGIGEVFLARRRGDQRRVALKRLLPDFLQEEDALARLKREAHVAALLAHDNIATVVGASEYDGHFCVATEFIAGRDLESIREALGAPFPPEVVVKIATDVLAALAYAHDAEDGEGRPLNLVHRDLSSRNVMIGFDGTVKIIDFGIARATVDEHRTRTGAVIGTPNYLSPEQATGTPVDRRSDLYTVSALFYELLTNRRTAHGESIIQVLRSVVVDAPPPIRSIVPAVPEGLEAAVMRGLDKDVDGRWPNAGAYLEAVSAHPSAGQADLQTLLGRLFPDGETPVPIGTEVPQNLTVAAVDRAALVAPRPPRTRWGLWGLVAAALLITTIAGAALLREPAAPLVITEPPTRAPPVTPTVVARPSPPPAVAPPTPPTKRAPAPTLERKAPEKTKTVEAPPPVAPPPKKKGSDPLEALVVRTRGFGPGGLKPDDGRVLRLLEDVARYAHQKGRDDIARSLRRCALHCQTPEAVATKIREAFSALRGR